MFSESLAAEAGVRAGDAGAEHAVCPPRQHRVRVVSSAINQVVAAVGGGRLFQANIFVSSFFFYMILQADGPREMNKAVYLVLSLTGVVLSLYPV